MIVATAQFRYHFLSAGITCHGACSVLVRSHRLREGRLVVVPLRCGRRGRRGRNFQCFVGLVEARLEPLASARPWRCGGSTFTIVVPSSASMLLEVVDVVVAPPPPRLGHEVEHPHREHVLVVAAVEHADLAVGRHVGVDAPQVVAGQLGLASAP